MSDLRPNSQIADGIHWLKDKYVNNYIIEYEDDLILIDTALNKKANGIISYSKHELESRKISKILLTHHHMDHTRGLGRLHHLFHPRVFSSKEDHPVITGERKSPLPKNPLLKPLFYIIRSLVRVEPVLGVEIVKDGDIIDGIEVKHLPGHTMGSLGFMKSSAVFSGDAAVTNKKGEVVYPPNVVTESFDALKNSIKKLAEYQFDIILPGHGPPILEDASNRVRDAVERYGI